MNKLIQYAVMVTVGVLIFSALLIPIINDATTTDKTYTNSGYYRMAEIGDESVTIEWDHTAPRQLEVNGDIVSMENVPVNTVTTMLVTDQTIVRYAYLSNQTLIQIYSSSGYYGASTTANTDMTITISDGTLTADNGASPITKTITSGYYASNDGKWIMKSPNNTAYIHKSDSIIVLAGNTEVSDTTVGIFANGSINEGLDITNVPVGPTEINPTFGDTTFSYVDVAGYVDLVKLTNCKFDITLNNTTATATYTYFLVPYEVTAELSTHADDSTRAIIGVIPLIVIVGLIAGIVGVIAIRRGA